MMACHWGRERGMVIASTTASQHDEGPGRSSLRSQSHIKILRSVHIAFSHPGPRKPFLLKDVYGTSWYPLHSNHPTRKNRSRQAYLLWGNGNFAFTLKSYGKRTLIPESSIRIFMVQNWRMPFSFSGPWPWVLRDKRIQEQKRHS